MIILDIRDLPRYGFIFSILDCLTTLGSHLQQVYILEATLQYGCREYRKIQRKFMYEAPDSPAITKLKEEITNIKMNIGRMKKELKHMKTFLTKVIKYTNCPYCLLVSYLFLVYLLHPFTPHRKQFPCPL